MRKRITGLMAATFTPMDEDGGLNPGTIEGYAAFLADDGVANLYVNGSTGEGISLTTDERMTTARRWMEVAGHEMTVIVHVGSPCLPDCQALAAHAQKIGAWGISCIPPSFFRPATMDDLAVFYAEVAAAAPKLPFYCYHIPVRTGVDFPMVEFLPIAAKKIPTLAGAKFTDASLDDFARCVALEDGRFDMLFGRDQMLLGALAMGARGAIGSTYNFNAPVCNRILAAFDAGDLAAGRAEQLRSIEAIDRLHALGGLGVFKAVMKLIGMDCGPVRLPLRRLADDEIETVRRTLEEIGFFDWRKE